MDKTTIQDLGEFKGNRLWMKREDLIPFSFGGNKVRKAYLFFQVIDEGEYNCVVTYGSRSSNHCRVVANMCSQRGIACFLISPEEVSGSTFNSQMMELCGAEIIIVPVSEVHSTIEYLLAKLKSMGKKPYFIEGGGHGNIGTEAYVQCYQEIVEQEQMLNTHFDYIFFASGTGTTHAGMVCGKLLNHDERKIVGISIARKNPRGGEIVQDSIKSYMGNKSDDETIHNATIFIDEYASVYGKEEQRVFNMIENVLKTYGIPLDSTYTGKAFWGMSEYIESECIKGNNILFIHTGGTPLFFDALGKRDKI